MVHRVVFRVALRGGARLLGRADAAAARELGGVLFHDPEGLALELVVDDSGDEPLVAKHPEIPEELALRGFAGVRAYASDPDAARRFLDAARLRAAAGRRAATSAAASTSTTTPPAARGVPGAAARCTTSPGPRRSRSTRRGARRSIGGRRPADAGDRPLLLPLDLLPRAERRAVRDRDARRPGFAADEPLETLGERLSLPPKFEPLREQLEQRLTPLPNPRASTRGVTSQRAAGRGRA